MKSQNLQEISQQVKLARKNAGMNQQDLADFSGVSRKFISDLENEKQTLEIGKVLAVLAALGIAWLLIDRFRK
ncbi:MAG TPA: transcriptional regulator [Alphaproteobacteria bacterium]|nr:transcriptional regulator [Alphaproteobacteria bacterium]